MTGYYPDKVNFVFYFILIDITSLEIMKFISIEMFERI